MVYADAMHMLFVCMCIMTNDVNFIHQWHHIKVHLHVQIL